jgi:hypothetical protein
MLKKLILLILSQYFGVMALDENTCPKCGAAFPTKEALVQHVKEHEKDIEQRPQNLDFYPQ